MLFDTHAHLNDPAFDPDRRELLDSFPAAGIGLVMNVGCSLATSRDSLALAQQYPYIYTSVGTHPDAADEVNAEVIEEYRKLCKLHPEKIKAIGEIGLDYYYEDIPREVQKKAFIAQMELAQELDLPVIVHERDAHADGFDIIRAFPEVKGVFHCYSGSAEMARQLTDRGWYIGFTGVLTFKNARRAVEAARILPRDRVVIETDCPFMSPEPFRGRRNDPTRVYRMAEALAQIWDVTPEEAQSITFENGKRLYRIDL
jgi:TatD DNase family protein